MSVFRSKLAWLLMAIMSWNTIVAQKDLVISGGNTVSSYVCSNRKAYVWGANDKGQLGLGRVSAYESTPQAVTVGGASPVDIQQISSGSGAHFVAIDCNNNPWAWGMNDNGQVGNGAVTPAGAVGIPTRVLADASIASAYRNAAGQLINVDVVYAGTSNTFAILDNGELVSWGANTGAQAGQLGQGNTTTSSNAAKYVLKADGTRLTGVKQIFAGDNAAFALVDPDGDGVGTVYSWGNGQMGNLGRNLTGTGNPNNDALVTDGYARPVYYDSPDRIMDNIRQISATDVGGLVLDESGYVWTWGNDWGGVDGNGVQNNASSAPKRVVKGDVTGAGTDGTYLLASSIGGGQGFAMAITKDRKPVAWGNNGGCSGGALGDGSTNGALAPVYIKRNGAVDNDVVLINRGDLWGFYARSNGSFYAWGCNAVGQLGIGSTITQTSAVPLTPPGGCALRDPAPQVNLSPGDMTVCEEDFLAGTGLVLNSGFIPNTGLEAVYQITWFKDNAQVRQGTAIVANRTYTATTKGTYRVEIVYTGTNAGCVVFDTAKQEMTIDYYPATFTTIAGTYCGDSATVKVNSTNTTNAVYSYYATMTSTTVLGTSLGSTSSKISIAGVTGSSPKTIYVEETGYASGSVGTNGQMCGAFTEDANVGAMEVGFVAYENVNLQSFDIHLINKQLKISYNDASCNCNLTLEQTGTVNVGLYSARINNGVWVPNTLITTFSTSLKVKDLGAYTATINTNDYGITGNASGEIYFLKATSVTGFTQMIEGRTSCAPSYPLVDNIDGSFLNITHTTEGGNPATKYGTVNNIKFSAKQHYCNRLPLTLVELCPCNKPASVSITAPLVSPTVLCEGAALTLTGRFNNGNKVNAGTLSYAWYKLGTLQSAITYAAVAPVPATSATNVAVPNKAFAATVAASDSGKWVLRVEDGTAGSVSCYTEDTVHIKIDKPVVVGKIAMDTTLCYKTNAPAFTEKTAATGGNGRPFKYKWYQSAKSPVNFTRIIGAEDAIYDPGVLNDTTLFYRRDSSGVCTPANTQTVQVNMLKELKGGKVGRDTSICTGTAPVAFKEEVPATGGDKNYKYQWQSTTNLTNGFTTDIASATSATYTAPALSQTTYYRRVTKTTKPVCNEVYSDTIIITVIAQNEPGAILKDDSTCFGVRPSAILNDINKPVTGSTAPVYSWIYQEQGSTTWTLITDSARAELKPNVLAKTTSFARIAKTGTGTCNLDTTAAVTITVYNALDAGTIGTDTTVCSGNAPRPFRGTLPTGGKGKYEFQWIESQTNAAPWTPISTGNTKDKDSTYAVGAQTKTTLFTNYYKRIATSDNCIPDTSNFVKLVVLPPVTAGTIIDDVSICPYTHPAKFSESVATTGGDGVYFYRWQRAEKINGNFVFKDIVGATNKDVFPTQQDTVETRYRRIDSSATCASKTTLYKTATMLDTGEPGELTIVGQNEGCANTISINITATPAVPRLASFIPTYKWVSSIDSGQTWLDLGYTNPSPYIDNNKLNGSIWIAREAIVGSGACDNIRSLPKIFNIYEQTVAGSIAKDTTICANGDARAFTVVKPTKGNGTYHYQWQESTNNGALWGNVSSNSGTYPAFPDSSVFDPVSLTQTTSYRRVITSGNCAAVTEVGKTVTVIQKNIVTVNLADPNPSFCIHSPAKFVALSTNGGTGRKFHWYIDGDDKTPAGTTDSTFTVSTLTQGQRVKVELISDIDCPVNKTVNAVATVTIRDSITPTIKLLPVNESCVGQLVNIASSSTGAGSVPKYEWFVDGVSVGNNNDSLSSTSFKNGDNVQVVLTADSANMPCYTTIKATSLITTLLIRNVPAPDIAQLDTNVCEGDNVRYLVHNKGGAIKWYKDQVELIGETDSVLTITNAKAIASGKYSAVEIRTACKTASDTVKVKVIPIPVADAGDPEKFALDGDTVMLNGSGDGRYEWTPSSSLNDATLRNPKFKAVDIVTYVLTVSDSTLGRCNSKDSIKILVERPIIIVNTFTPNGDGVNDGWVIKNIESFPKCLVKIYNRWGNLVWESNSYPNPWDGTDKFNGQLLPDGTYFYIIELNSTHFKNPYQGWVQIVK